jgi:hypothetical protein
MWIFLWRTKQHPVQHYYVVADGLNEVIQSCRQVSRMTYMGRLRLGTYAQDIDSIPIPGIDGVFYANLNEIDDDRWSGSSCRCCNNLLCGKSPSGSLQSKYNRRQLSRYPGKAGEEYDDVD